MQARAIKLQMLLVKLEICALLNFHVRGKLDFIMDIRFCNIVCFCFMTEYRSPVFNAQSSTKDIWETAIWVNIPICVQGLEIDTIAF